MVGSNRMDLDRDLVVESGNLLVFGNETGWDGST